MYNNFITLFDKRYLSRGLALYHSLGKNHDAFLLYVLAMDTHAETYLQNLNQDNLRVISLSSIESFYPELLSIKEQRTIAEYCWTLTPYCIQYAIKMFNLDSLIYLDADVYFFNNPQLIFDGKKDYSVLITEHRYTPQYDSTKTSGKYCVQFMFFKNDGYGMETLEWWRQRCQEWCYRRVEDGKFGDQKYLDDWITRFKGVYVPTHLGCGLAPWNIQQYEILLEDNQLLVRDQITKVKQPVVFFHFHGLERIKNHQNRVLWYLGEYPIEESSRKYLYKEYIARVLKIEKNIDDKVLTPAELDFQIFPVSFLSVIKMVIKSCLEGFLIVRRYKFLRDRMIKENNDKMNRILEIPDSEI